MSTNHTHNAMGEDRAALGSQMQDNLGESSGYVGSSSHVVRSGSGMRLRRRLQQALAVVAVLMMLTAFAPRATTSDGSDNYAATLSTPATTYGSWYGYYRCNCNHCCNAGAGGNGGTVANHNETLVEDVD